MDSMSQPDGLISFGQALEVSVVVEVFRVLDEKINSKPPTGILTKDWLAAILSSKLAS
jgi:hypothetical protein